MQRISQCQCHGPRWRYVSSFNIINVILKLGAAELATWMLALESTSTGFDNLTDVTSHSFVIMIALTMSLQLPVALFLLIQKHGFIISELK